MAAAAVVVVVVVVVVFIVASDTWLAEDVDPPYPGPEAAARLDPGVTAELKRFSPPPPNLLERDDKQDEALLGAT